MPSSRGSSPPKDRTQVSCKVNVIFGGNSTIADKPEREGVDHPRVCPKVCTGWLERANVQTDRQD